MCIRDRQCLGPTARTTRPPQTAAPTVEALSHTYAVRRKVPIGYNGVTQMRPQKYPFPWTDPQTPLVWSASYLDPSDLWCQTASGSDPPFFHNALARLTDRPTDHSRESLTTIGRCAPRATQPNNNNNNNTSRIKWLHNTVHHNDASICLLQIDRLVSAGANMLAPIPVGPHRQIGTVVDYAYYVYNLVSIVCNMLIIKQSII